MKISIDHSIIKALLLTSAKVGEDGMTNCDALDDYELEDYVYSVHRLEVNF